MPKKDGYHHDEKWDALIPSPKISEIYKYWFPDPEALHQDSRIAMTTDPKKMNVKNKYFVF
jgi:hypothetical protein